MTTRARILEAAARLFSQLGYEGTTTRRIAHEAGVSEVTVFRQFRTKDALLHEALAESEVAAAVKALPETPENPEAELARWCAGYLRQLRGSRAVIRRAMGQLADRPSIVPHATAYPATALRVLREYLLRAERRRLLPEGFDVTAAATVLAGVLFADALGRDLMPDEFPRPARTAPERYVRIVLGGCARQGPDRAAGARAGRFDRRHSTHVPASSAAHVDGSKR
ncbi:MAG TPA: helix-turn-helix domain-containing protein [Gemmatimonadaceae bacterium]|nr:helix-turn-helix domain-containing protein [Gemmatimonadaceae bacterium]